MTPSDTTAGGIVLNTLYAVPQRDLDRERVIEALSDLPPANFEKNCSAGRTQAGDESSSVAYALRAGAAPSR
jgi:hypothetical protein